MPPAKNKIAARKSKAAPNQTPPSGATPTALPVKTIVWRLAGALYPARSPVDARKLIRERIRYARNTGALPKSDPVDTECFVTWVRERVPEWDYEKIRQALPLPAYRAEFAGAAKSRSNATGTFLMIPTDRETLAKLYAESCREIESLQRRLSDLEAECERAAARREKGRNAGRRGGRGNIAF